MTVMSENRNTGGGAGRLDEQQREQGVGGRFEQDREQQGTGGAGASAAMQTEAAARQWASFGESVGTLINRKIIETPNLKYPHNDGREWKVVGLEAEKGLKLQDPSSPTNYDYLAFDEKVMAGILPRLFV
jgi:hypothetical protein